jgi:Tol biopolymer transport system component
MIKTEKTWIRVVLSVTATLLVAGLVSGCRGEEGTTESPVSPLPPPTTVFSSSITPPPQPLSGRVAFTSDAAGSYGVYVLDLSTNQVEQVASSPARDVDPDWSPSGDLIVFGSARNNPDELDIFMVSSDGSGLTQLTDNPGFEVAPTWSADGKYIAFHSDEAGDFEIYVQNLEAGEAVRVTNSPGVDYQVDWSPDGERLVFASARVNRSEIWVMDADGTNPVQLTDWPSSAQAHPRWSPDGKTILFTSDKDGEGAVYTIPVTGGEAVRVSPAGIAAETPAWAMNGKAILYSATSPTDTNLDLWMLPLAGGDSLLIWSSPGNDSYPAWTP